MSIDAWKQDLTPDTDTFICVVYLKVKEQSVYNTIVYAWIFFETGHTNKSILSSVVLHAFTSQNTLEKKKKQKQSIFKALLTQSEKAGEKNNISFMHKLDYTVS